MLFNSLGILSYLCFIILISKQIIVVSYETQFQLEAKPSLKPDEIIYLLAKETQNIKSKKRKHGRRYHKDITSTTQVEYGDSISDTNDEDVMKAHKVWSRWGKWGECSVTCGEGVISRRRVCVAGRCAPGEHEEQHRPCTKMPCSPVVDALELVDAD